MRTLFALFGALALTVPATAQAQDVCTRIAEVSIGQWAEYRITAPELGNQAMAMRMAIVGEESRGGTRYYWYEMSMGTPQGDLITQVLVPGWPYDEGQITEMVMKVGEQPAMRLSGQMIAMMADAAGGSPAQDALAACTGAERLGTERVTVPAGAFDALHMRPTDGDGEEVWVSADVPFGIIRMESPEAQMELTDHGDGATSSISETPTGR